jgi:hypothetical protein
MAVTNGTRRGHCQSVNLRNRIAVHPAVTAVGSAQLRATQYLRGRKAHPWTAMITVPLAMTAAMLLVLWWTWPPLLLCAWWWADHTTRWTWVVAVEAGLLGTQWAYLGVYAVSSWPRELILIGACWTAYPLLLALVCWQSRHRARREAYAGY